MIAVVAKAAAVQPGLGERLGGEVAGDVWRTASEPGVDRRRLAAVELANSGRLAARGAQQVGVGARVVGARQVGGSARVVGVRSHVPLSSSTPGVYLGAARGPVGSAPA